MTIAVKLILYQGKKMKMKHHKYNKYKSNLPLFFVAKYIPKNKEKSHLNGRRRRTCCGSAASEGC